MAGSGSGSISQRHGSADPDPDPPQNFMDPQHWWTYGEDLGRLGSIQVLEDISKSVRESRVFLTRYFHTDKKEDQFFLMYKEIQNGAVAKSYMTDGLLVKYLRISSHIRKPSLHHLCFATAPFLHFLIYEETLIFFLISPFGHFHSCYPCVSLSMTLAFLHLLVL